MSYKEKVKYEVAKSFKDNPDLYKKTFEGLAEWFYIQGQIRHDSLLEALKSKVAHYRSYLEFEDKVKADRGWEDGTYNKED